MWRFNMLSIRNLTMALLGAVFLLNTAPAQCKTQGASWAEEINDASRGQLARECLEEYRKASRSRNSEGQKLWKTRHNILREKNEFEPLSPLERARLKSLVDGSHVQATPQYRALYASL